MLDTSKCLIFDYLARQLTKGSVPYIADAFHNESNTEYYDMRGALFYDPVITYTSVQQSIPATQMVEYWDPVFNLNDTFMADLNKRSEDCGYNEFIDTAMTFPPSGPLPDPPKYHTPECEIWKDVHPAAAAVNPCWDVYDILTTCKNYTHLNELQYNILI